ncbi:Alpha/Beta hydrolase protein [Pisolithus albus]|nr:Alpha/Beta hydrolase protein [Pisolithus albus]
MSCAASRPRTKEIVDPTYPLLEANRSVIESIRRETFTYGSSDVHKLDVYYPPLPGSDGLPPILVFFYGSEDVRDAIEWTIENVAEGDSNRVFLLGHSAGGLHLASYLLLPSLYRSSSAFGRMRGAILMGVPCEILPVTKKVSVNHPLSLLRQTDDSHICSLPPVWNIMVGSEPRAISTSMRTFAREFRKRGSTVDEFVLEGHDHLSPILALSSGSGEDWSYDVVRWIMG